MFDDIFSIDELNEHLKSCSRCRLSKTRKHVLCGEGCLDARIMLIAQAPGIKEDNQDAMFIGPSGLVLDELLEKNGVARDELYMTNLLKCMLPRYRKPKQDEIFCCSSFLDVEIELINPSFLVPLGHYATKYVLLKYGLDVPSKQEFFKLYGKLLGAKNRKILPLQHPAAAVHNPDLKDVLMKNYHKLKVISKECKWYAVCPMKRFFESGLLEKRWVDLYCWGDWERCVRFQMEEAGKSHEDFMLPDGSFDKSLR